MVFRLPYGEPVDRISYGVERARGKSVLHIGCTGGDLSENAMDSVQARLERSASYCLGIDILDCQVSRYAEAGLNVMLADAEDFNLGKKFDVVYAGEVIEHLSNPGAFIQCANRHQNIRGELIITSPQPWSATRLLASLVMKAYLRPHPGHTSWYDPYLIGNLLSRYGYTIVELHPSGADLGNWLDRLAYRRSGVFYPEFVVVATKMEEYSPQIFQRIRSDSQITRFNKHDVR